MLDPSQTNDLATSFKFAPPRGLLPEPFWVRHQWEIAVVLGLFVVLASVAFWLWRRRKSATIIPPVPAEQARRELQQLQGRSDAAVVEISRIIRRFLIAQCGLPSGELTTTELCDAVQSRPGVSAEAAKRAADFLRRCEVLKFAPDAKAPPADLVNEASGLIDSFVAPALPPVLPVQPSELSR